ncbi:MAG TPA: hypothetical protein VJ729_13525 [Nitrososphaeraceae archaeon]|nr:hypothetical protein [Nitrososphaeraceae archaeon]
MLVPSITYSIHSDLFLKLILEDAVTGFETTAAVAKQDTKTATNDNNFMV